MNKEKRLHYILTVICLLIIYSIIATFISTGTVSRYQLGILVIICINVILSVSLNVTVGCLGQIALGHAGFMSVGAYTAALISKNIFGPGLFGYIIALIGGGIVAGIIGILVGIPALRLKGDYLAIITLAFGEIIRVFVEYFKFTGGAQGLRSIPRYNNFTVIFIIMVASIAMMYSFMTTRHGRAILAIREDEFASSASGINVTFYKTLAFTMSAVFAGVAGGIYAHNIGILGAKQFDFNYSINILVMVVLGGMGSFTGAIISAIILTILPEVLRGFSDYRMIVYSLVLILMMIFRPTGLLGRSEFQISLVIKKLRKYFNKNFKTETLEINETLEILEINKTNKTIKTKQSIESIEANRTDKNKKSEKINNSVDKIKNSEDEGDEI